MARKATSFTDGAHDTVVVLGQDEGGLFTDGADNTVAVLNQDRGETQNENGKQT